MPLSNRELRDSEWVERARLLEARQRGQHYDDRESALRTTLAALHNVVLAARATLRQSFQEFLESELVSEAERAMGRVRLDNFGWWPEDERPVMVMRSITAQARALDGLLREEARPRIPVDPEEAWSCEEEDCYVIPRAHLRATSRPSLAQAYARRALLYHRVLPRWWGGQAVRLYTSDSIAPGGATPAMKLGGALFDDLTVKYDPRTFQFGSVQCRDVVGTVAEQVSAARKDECFGLVWPELIVPPEALEIVRERLRAKPASERGHLQLAVAGSWHRTHKSGTGFTNTATVLDGYGEKILFFHKVLRYREKSGASEAITPDDELHVLVTETQLVAFAICRDFCERDEQAPVVGLDVDLVLVPSLANCATALDHQKNANDMAMRFRSRVFVVQQAYPRKDGEPLGWVVDGSAEHPSRQTGVYACYPHGREP